MEITKLVGNIDQIKAKVASKLQAQPEKILSDQMQLDNMLMCVAEYKKWTGFIAGYAKDSSLQDLPLEYYQVCARHFQRLYDQNVVSGIPKLIEMGIIDKNGNLL